MKGYNVIWNRMSVSCTSQTLVQPLKKSGKRSITDVQRRDRKWNHKFLKTTKGRKRVEYKNWNKAQGQQIENSNEYSEY